MKRKYVLQLGLTFFLLASIAGSTYAVTQNTFYRARAATRVSVETENASLSGPLAIKADANTSGGSYIEFSPSNTDGQPTSPPSGGMSGSSFQPSAPYYGTFFYLWFKNPNTDDSWSYWTDIGNSPPNTWFSYYIPDPIPGQFDPANELYSSNNYDIFKWQAQKMLEAKQEVAIASWWGQGRKEDIAFERIINDFMGRADNPYPNLRWTIYYELEGNGDPSVDSLVADLAYIKNNYASSNYYLKIDSKPVIFVYANDQDLPGTMTQRWKEANLRMNNEFYVVLKVFAGYKNDPDQPDSWHQYAPAVRSATHAPYSSFVSPGFWLDNGDPERLVRDLNSFRSAVSSMVNANVTWKLVQTWNEWGEGTSVEPGQRTRINASTNIEEIDQNGPEFGNAYIDVLNSRLPSLEAGSGR